MRIAGVGWLPRGLEMAPHMALVGCGRWGMFILRDLLSLGCEVTVVGRREITRNRALGAGACATVASLADLPQVAGAVVASPTVTHGDVIEALLEREIPIFTEKPLTNDPASAARIAQRAGDRVFVMDKWRYHPGVEKLGEIVRSGRLGAIRGIRTTRLQCGNPHHDVDAVWILAPHDLAVALEVLGEIPEPRSAVADRMRDPRTGHEIVTGFLGILGSDPWLVIEVSSRHTLHVREMRVYGDDAIAILDDAYSDHIALVRPGEPHDMKEPEIERIPISKELPLLRELRAFVEHLGGGPPPRSSAAEGARQVEVVATLRRQAGLDGGSGKSS